MNPSTHWIGLLLCSMACYAAEADKRVVVNRDCFSAVYPAVWFSPSTGEMTPLVSRSEAPPEAKYEIWIEPRDPEIRLSNNHTNAGAGKTGFALVGQEADVFNRTNPVPTTKLEPNLVRLVKESPNQEELVFYCQARASSCLLMILEIDPKREVVSFRWKPLPPWQP